MREKGDENCKTFFLQKKKVNDLIQIHNAIQLRRRKENEPLLSLNVNIKLIIQSSLQGTFHLHIKARLEMEMKMCLIEPKFMQTQIFECC